jgi:phage portal protein BeeE
VGTWIQRLFGANVETSPPQSVRARLAAVAEQLALIDIFELPSIVAGRQLTADTAAMMKLVGFSELGGRLNPTPSLLRRPDPQEPYRDTIEKIVNAMTRWDIAWLYVPVYDSAGWPLAVEQIDNGRLNVTWKDPARKVLDNATLDGRAIETKDLHPVKFVQDGPVPDRSPIERVRAVLEQLIYVYRWGAEYYGAGAVPPYAVVHPNRVTDVQASEFMDQWLTARAERRPALLSGGIAIETYNPASASDALLLEAVNYLDAVAARVQQIPPSLLNTAAQSSLTYSTTAAELNRWLKLGLYPGILSRIEAAFSDLMPRGQSAIFDTSNLVRMDQAERITTYATSIGAGIHTPAEARALEGLPELPDSDLVPISPNVEGL